MLLLAALVPFWGSVSAVNSFANATTPKASLPATTTTNTPKAATSSCFDPEDFDCLRSGLYGPPELLEGGYNIYEYEYSGATASQCSISFEASLSSWMATAAITTMSEVYTPDTGGLPYTTEYNVQFDNFFSYSPVEPCCGNCTLYGGDVLVYYWPTPAPTPGVTELVNAANFTFTSPSVYVAFQSLFATDLCGHVGKDIPSTTIAFAPGALSTALAYQYNFTGPDILDLGNNFTAASFGDEPRTCNNITSSFMINNVDGSTYPYDGPLPPSVQTYCSATPESCDLNFGSMTYNPCSPTLSVPSQLFTLNAQWKGCNQGIDAFFDPPYTLTQGGGLTAFNTPASPSPSPTPEPQVSANAPTPTPTPTPSPTPSPDPSPSQDPTPSPDSSPNQDPAPNQTPTTSPKATPPQNSPSQQPQTHPQATPGSSPIDPNTPVTTQTMTPIPFVAGTQTITPGSPAVTISGTTYSVPSSGGAVTINNSITQSIPQPQASTPIPFVAGTQTITPGAPAAVISGTTYSVPLSGGAVIINNSITKPIPQPQAQTPGSPNADPTPTYVLGSQTLVAGGPAITVSSSIVLSLMSGGQSVVIEDSSTTETMAITAAFTMTEGVLATGTSTGLGSVIVSIGGFTTPTTTSVSGNGTAGYTGISFLGSGSRISGIESFKIWLIGAGLVRLGILVL